MPETRASNKSKHPGKCLLAAGSDLSEANEKQKRKRRTKEEMLILREEQARVAEKKAAENAAHEKEHQELLKKIAELEMKQAAADNHNKGLRHKVDVARLSDSESQPKKKAKVHGNKKPAMTKPAPRPKTKKTNEDEGEAYEPKTPAPGRKYGKKKPYVELDEDESALGPKTPMPREKYGSEGEVIPDSQMDEPDSRSHQLQGKQKMSTQQEIEAMKTNMQNVVGQHGDGNSHVESVLFTHVLPKMLLTPDETTLFFYSFRTKSDTVKENHECLNKWLTDYVRTPQDNAEVERRPAGSKRVPSSRGGNSKTTTTAVGSSHTVATLDIIEIDDDSDDVPEFEEDQTVERDAAHSSPLKNGKRLTSKSMVKVVLPSKKASAQKRVIVKEEPLDDAERLIAPATKPKPKPKSQVTVKSEPDIMSEDRGSAAASSEDEGSEIVKKKRRERPMNDSCLPPALAASRRLWRPIVLPTLINYVGSFHNPWTISDDKIIAYLQPILNHFLPRADRYTVQASDSLLGLVTQRLNEWRSVFSSTAIAVLDSFFGSVEQTPLAARQQFANDMLKNKAFLYAEPRKKLANGEVRPAGIFRGSLVLQTFVAHLKAVLGAESDIAGLEHPQRGAGALALAVIAAERALKLWQKGYLQITREGSQIVAWLNPSTGKLSKKVLLWRSFSGDASIEAQVTYWHL
ncbi:hypothetical protein F5887DRAFT_919606 [Amanita rubescens]|nr:hypothetical protein F5887DRAFT_919606 [Amanita rubescens]